MNKWTTVSLVVAGILIGLFWEHARGSAGSSSAEYAWSVARECVSYLVAYLALSRSRAAARLIYVTLLGAFIAILLFQAEDIIRFHDIVVSDGLLLNAGRVFSTHRVRSFLILVPLNGTIVWALTSLVQAAIGFVHQHFQRA